ncbi:hypothetical protein FHS82_002874 [Pseudochelatococcus lubricantis]|uniref:Uncharacterized protein n=1 Tax=Pseudochelatococcus lubricantis TaxID=1538102 RepID=A0ABX0V4K9_9HYPH|nr:hypothetical protein [Pseudochelatococcus lubricantis]
MTVYFFSRLAASVFGVALAIVWIGMACLLVTAELARVRELDCSYSIYRDPVTGRDQPKHSSLASCRR